MKRKIIKCILLFIFILVFNVSSYYVNAKNKYTCQYYNSTGIEGGTGADVTYTFAIEIDKDSKMISSYWVDSADTQNNDSEWGEVNFLFDQYFDFSYDSEYIVDNILKGKDVCQDEVQICKIGDGFTGVHFGILFDTSLSSDISSGENIAFINSGYLDSSFANREQWYMVGEYEKLKSKCSENHSSVICQSYIGRKKFAECKLFKYDEEYKENGNSKNIEYKCKRYSNDNKNGLYDKLKKYYNNYQNCKKKKANGKNTTCDLSKIATNYNKTYDILREYCSSVIKTQYSSQPCMEKCLGMSKDLDNYRINNNKLEGYKCYLSEGIIAFVYNILKWAKYIVPALVIILSILDFIKAIAASSDDDMKKAQSKFIKRLIVAAILFLLPLIINFMLKTFGLYNSKCDIGSLFS